MGRLSIPNSHSLCTPPLSTEMVWANAEWSRLTHVNDVDELVNINCEGDGVGDCPLMQTYTLLSLVRAKLVQPSHSRFRFFFLSLTRRPSVSADPLAAPPRINILRRLFCSVYAGETLVYPQVTIWVIWVRGYYTRKNWNCKGSIGKF